METRAALRNIYFLKMLPDAAIEAIARAGTECRLRKGEVLFLEKDRCLGLVVVLEGAIKVYKLDSRGRELTLDLEKPGESVAEIALFDGGNYPANAEAVEDSRLLLVPPERFRAIMAAYPEIAGAALKALGIRMRKLMQTLEAQALYTVRARLADYLLAEAAERTTFRLSETNEGIANRLGTVREVISRTLRILADTGAITLNGREVTLQEPEILRRIAGSSE